MVPISFPQRCYEPIELLPREFRNSARITIRIQVIANEQAQVLDTADILQYMFRAIDKPIWGVRVRGRS